MILQARRVTGARLDGSALIYSVLLAAAATFVTGVLPAIRLSRLDPRLGHDLAAEWGITGQDQIVVMVHCGSRGFGHQVASDYLKMFENNGAALLAAMKE